MALPRKAKKNMLLRDASPKTARTRTAAFMIGENRAAEQAKIVTQSGRGRGQVLRSWRGAPTKGKNAKHEATNRGVAMMSHLPVLLHLGGVTSKYVRFSPYATDTYVRDKTT